ncbi:tape measure protein [Lewinella sp. JB7]|uniref:tape measure protein n=1 Tax=Lewinella sp. JB7 TaxID=2962887 RepID=UPI0020C99355|nr:tape measure protein [Lewinella sp. JB7]MCP9237160.1 tape measure protein [Lewinella sp. JB7]
MASSDLKVRLGADLSALANSLKGAENQLKRFGYKAERLGRDLTTRVSLPILGIGAAAVSTFAGFDKAEKGLAVFAGSTEQGAKQLAQLLNVVKDTRTTLDLKVASDASLKLQAVGQSAAQAQETVKQLGIAATVSGSSIDDVGGVVRQFSQIIGKGKIEQEDLNSILDRMPALAKVIKDEFGASTAEEIRGTGIAMQTFVSRLIAAIDANEDFQNVQGGITKALDSFGVELQVAGKELGEVITKTFNLEENLGRLAGFISRSVAAFKSLSPAMQKTVIVGASAAAAIGPLTFGLGAAARTVPLLTSGFKLLAGPLGSMSKLALTFGKSIGSAFTIFVKGSAIVRATTLLGGLTKVLGLLKIGLGALLSPIGITVAVVGSLVAGFVLAYKRSEFFRGQIARLGKQLEPVIDLIKDLAGKVLGSLGIKAKSVGDAFLSVFGAVGASISFIIEAVDGFTKNLGLLGKALGSYAKLDFTAGDAFLDATSFSRIGGRAAQAFRTTFDQITAEPVKVGGAKGEEVVVVEDPVIPSGNGDKKQVNNARRVRLLGDNTPSLSKGDREALSKMFTDLVATRREATFLQEQLDGLQVNPDLDAQPINSMKSLLASLGTEIQENLGTAFAEVDIKAQLFGSSFDALSEKINLTKDAIIEALEEGLQPTDDVVAALIERLQQLQEEQDETTEKFGEMSSALEALEQVSSSAFDQVAKAMNDGASAVKAFGATVVASIRDAIAAEIKLAVATQVASALKSVPFPFNVGLAAGAGAAAGALFTTAINALKIPALAAGGITTGPTLALIGEAGQEAVIPLDKLNDILGNRGGDAGAGLGGSVEFIIRGDNLVGVLDRARPAYNRSF